jgi:prepilin-type N-terminal cleavage/methylation domain-containing protein
METLRLHPKRNRATGFSVLEVLVAITILAIGLSAMAALVASSLAGTERARYLAVATTLTSEKLEDLNRWTNADPHVAAGGSLTSDGSVGSINYYDDIDLSNTTGQVSETFATGGGTSTVIHKSTGEVIPSSTAAAPSGSGVIAFHRRWLVESNPVVNGITLTGSRRVTVSVALSNGSVHPAVNFQMSVVRP